MAKVPEQTALRKGGDSTKGPELVSGRGERAAAFLDWLDEQIETRVRAALEKARAEAEADPWLDAEGAAKLLGVSAVHAMRMARKGEIAASKLGKKLGWRFRRSDVLAYLESKRRAPAPAAPANDIGDGAPTDGASVLAELGIQAQRGRR